MLTIQHRPTKTDHTIITEWEELTLDVAVKVAQIELKPAQDRLDWFEQLDAVKQLWRLFATIDPEQVHPSELVAYFTAYILPMVQDITGEWPKTYQPKGIEAFEHKGIRYEMPKSLVIDEQTVVLQHTQTARPFVEASNLLSEYSKLRREGIKQMAMFTAAVVKQKQGEKWDEATVVERGKAFADLPMATVWEVFFCITQLTLKSINDTLQFTKEEIKALRVKKPAKGLAGKLGSLRAHRAELQAELKALTN